MDARVESHGNQSHSAVLNDVLRFLSVLLRRCAVQLCLSVSTWEVNIHGYYVLLAIDHQRDLRNVRGAPRRRSYADRSDGQNTRVLSRYQSKLPMYVQIVVIDRQIINIASQLLPL
jgi:hypothetical protein